MTETKQNVLYIYSFPEYLKGKPRVKIGRTSGQSNQMPLEIAQARIDAQVKTSHPEEPKILGAFSIPSPSVETFIHSDLKSKGLHLQDAPGNEWFEFPSSQELVHYVSLIATAEIVEDYSLLGYKRSDVEGESFESLIQAFGVKRCTGEVFKAQKQFIQILIEELSVLYPNFATWLQKTIQSDAVFNIAFRDGNAAGVAIWKNKGSDAAKLCTLFVLEKFRKTGIGRNLMLTCFEQWKHKEIVRIFVTTGRVNLIRFFERYGFITEGIAKQVYDRPNNEPEWYLSKLFMGDLHTDLTKAQILFPPISPVSSFYPARSEVTKIDQENYDIKLLDDKSHLVETFNRVQWLNILYPFKSDYLPKEAYIIPIRPQYLIQIFQAGKTVYYGRPSGINKDMKGAAILFYASAPISGVVAIARIVDRCIGTPSTLYSALGKKGVFSLEDIGADHDEKQSVEFDHLTPLQRVLTLEQLKEEGILKGQPQFMNRLSLENFQKAVMLAGVYAG